MTGFLAFNMCRFIITLYKAYIPTLTRDHSCFSCGDNSLSRVDSHFHNYCINIFADTLTGLNIPRGSKFEPFRQLSTQISLMRNETPCGYLLCTIVLVNSNVVNTKRCNPKRIKVVNKSICIVGLLYQNH